MCPINSFYTLGALLAKLGLFPLPRSDRPLQREAQRRDAETAAARLREEQALRRAEERFRITLRNSPIAVYTNDLELRYTWIHNPGFGFTAEQMLGRRDDELLPFEQAAPLMELKRAVIETGIGMRRELGIEHEGRKSFLDITIEPWFDAAGRITGVTAATVDITDRKRIEDALQQSEERFRLACESADMIAWELDPATGKTAPMGDVLRLLGTTEDRLSSADQYFEHLHPEDRDRAGRALQEALESGSPYDVDYRFVRPDGGVRWMNDRGRVAVDEHNRPLRRSGMLRDVTERKEAEEGLRRAMLAAEEANQAKDRFLATLSHELRTPLTPVLAVVAGLEEDARLPADVQGELAMVRRNVELEARLIDDLLDLTRIAHGKLELQPQAADVRQILEHAVQTCCGREAAAGRLRLVVDLADGENRVWGDTPRLSQVFWNLLNNAVKFTPAGGTIQVRMRVLEAGAEQGGEREIAVEVSDTGIGIEPETLPRIFDAFEQGDRGITRRFGGLGLGLAVSRAIVELHGGRLETRSEGKGKGATFTVRLPVRDLPAEVSDEPGVPSAPSQPHSADAAPSGARGGSFHILLVEDHADTAEAMTLLLTMAGHRVTGTATVADALAAAAAAEKARDRIDLVVSDLGLPDGNGQDLMRELVRRYGLRGIALSGYGMEEDIRKSLEAGFDRHLTKPVSPQLLKSVIQQAVEPVPGEARRHSRTA